MKSFVQNLWSLIIGCSFEFHKKIHLKSFYLMRALYGHFKNEHNIYIFKYKLLATINWSAWITWKSFCWTDMGEATCYGHMNKTQRLFLKLPLLCVLSFISSRPASLSHSISWLRQNASGTSSKQREACVQATHHRSCVVVSEEEPPPSRATYSDKPILLCWSKLLLSLRQHPPKDTHAHTLQYTHVHSAKQLEVNHCERQIKQGAGVKMRRVGISFVCSPASLPNWLIKLE